MEAGKLSRGKHHITIFLDQLLAQPTTQGIVRIYRLAANSSDPAFVGEVPSKGPSLVVALPPMSISTLDIH